MRKFLGALNKFEFHIKLLLTIQQQQDASAPVRPTGEAQMNSHTGNGNSSLENEILNTVSLSVDP